MRVIPSVKNHRISTKQRERGYSRRCWRASVPGRGPSSPSWPAPWRSRMRRRRERRPCPPSGRTSVPVNHKGWSIGPPTCCVLAGCPQPRGHWRCRTRTATARTGSSLSRLETVLQQNHCSECGKNACWARICDGHWWYKASVFADDWSEFSAPVTGVESFYFFWLRENDISRPSSSTKPPIFRKISAHEVSDFSS